MPSQLKFSSAAKEAVTDALLAEVEGKSIARAHGVSQAYVSKVNRELRFRDIDLDDIAPI